MLLYNKVDTFDEVKTKIERISAQEIQETAQFIFSRRRFIDTNF